MNMTQQANDRPISRLNLPTHEVMLAARRERARVLRAMIVDAVRKVLSATAATRRPGRA
jgi:hypothetical protein